MFWFWTLYFALDVHHACVLGTLRFHDAPVWDATGSKYWSNAPARESLMFVVNQGRRVFGSFDVVVETWTSRIDLKI